MAKRKCKYFLQKKTLPKLRIYTLALGASGQMDATSQNMMYEDMARRNHDAKAKAMDILNILHDKFRSSLQISVSLVKSTITPAEELAAARDRVAVTCKMDYKL